MSDDAAAPPPTIAQLPFFVSGRFPRPNLLGRCEGERVVLTSGRDLIERVREIGLGLQSLGMSAGDRVLLVGESCPEWLLADFAILTGGAVTVPVYPTLAAEQVGFICRDSGASVAILSTPAQLEKLVSIRTSIPQVRVAILMQGTKDDVAVVAGRSAGLEILRLEDVAERGHQAIRHGWGVGKAFQDRAKRVRPDDLATIIYTSGTTADPKGVMLTHGNLVSNLRAVIEVLPVHDEDTALSFLPLCHSFERMVAYLYLACGVSMIFAESIDTLGRDLRTVRPTVMTGVPRVYEKLHARAAAAADEASGLKRTVFRWASGVAERSATARAGTGRLNPWLGLQSRLADRLVFAKIREAFGGRLRFFVSGSAPLSDRLGRWFYGVGIPIVEGYGLTETSPVLNVNPLKAIRFGTVGPPVPGVEVRIAEDGEILAKGPNVMKAYYNRPDDTREAFVDGWFRTGDIGEIDERGYLKITDRKKELICTSGGKKIPPQPIEARLRGHPLISEAVLVGDNRHFPAVLIVPNLAALSARLGIQNPDGLAAAKAMVGKPDVQALYAEAVDAVNAHLAQFERIKKFHVLPHELTLQAGELTPTLKVKRRVIESKYREEIDAMYSS